MVIFRSRILEVEELRREAEKLERVLCDVQEDNDILEKDIYKYKETVKTLNYQNEELIAELERISDHDEDVRSIINRRERIEALIARAEAHLQRNQMSRKY